MAHKGEAKQDDGTEEGLSNARARTLAAVRLLLGARGRRVSGRTIGEIAGCSHQTALISLRWLIEHEYICEVFRARAKQPLLLVVRTPPEDDPAWREVTDEISRTFDSPTSNTSQYQIARQQVQERFLAAVRDLTVELGRPPRQSELAERLECTRANVGPLAQRLARSGHVRLSRSARYTAIEAVPDLRDPLPSPRETEPGDAPPKDPVLTTDVAPGPPVLQRTYTLRIEAVPGGVDPGPALWETHRVFNTGVASLFDVLLTFRGGLDPNLSGLASAGSERDLARVALALGWFSPETRRGAPPRFVIHADAGPGAVLEAFETILERHGIAEAERADWVRACTPALAAPLRADAVWVDRAAAFEEFAADLDIGAARRDAWRIVGGLYGAGYLAAYVPDPDERDLARSGRRSTGSGAGMRSRQLFGHLFGESVSYGSPPASLELREDWSSRTADLVKEAGLSLKYDRVRGRGVRGEFSSPGEFHRACLRTAAERLAYTVSMVRRQAALRHSQRDDDIALAAIERDPERRTALALLDAYRRRRGAELGMEREFRLRKPQIRGWQRLADAWYRLAPSRGAAAVAQRERLVTDTYGVDGEYGDHGFLRELAADEGIGIWQSHGKLDTRTLELYVAGHLARERAERLRQPIVVHPDPTMAPVFCVFGTGLPAIEFGRLSGTADPATVRLLTYVDDVVEMLPVRAVSRRLDREIGKGPPSERAAPVTRDTRAARRAAGATPDGPVTPIGVYDERPVRSRTTREKQAVVERKPKSRPPQWTARLVADRRELAGIAHISETDPTRAAVRAARLTWRLEVPIRLEPRGPFLEYAAIAGLRLEMRSGAVAAAPFSSRDAWRGHSFPFWHPLNAGRTGRAKFRLSRLPGLRILGARLVGTSRVACAVWEVVGSEEVSTASRRAGVAPPGDDAMWHLAGAVYRRIGADVIDDRVLHPGPWARLERQFFVSADDSAPRRASDAEVWAVHRIESALGMARPLVDRLIASGFGGTPAQARRLGSLTELGWAPAPEERAQAPVPRTPDLRLDIVTASAIRAVRIALIRQGLRAKVAYYLKAAGSSEPGRSDAFDAAMKAWERLRRFTEQPDLWAQGQWDALVPRGTSVDAARNERESIVECLDPASRETEVRGWTEEWAATDARLRQSIRELRKLILPRRSESDERDRRGRGGLGSQRTRVLVAYSALVNAYRRRPLPDNLEAAKSPQTGDTPGRSRLARTIAGLRKARRSALAAAIVTAALGDERAGRRPVHAVIFDDDHIQRENANAKRHIRRPVSERATAGLRDLISEGCQLHGLHFRIEPSSYCDLRDARTGAPGVRCREVSVAKLIGRVANGTGDVPGYEREVVAAHWDSSERTWRDADGSWRLRGGGWERIAGNRHEPCAVRVPDESGPILVSADPQSTVGAGVDAHLNAAASFGLQPLFDPDWPGSWWVVPIVANEGTLARDFGAGSPALDGSTVLLTPQPLARQARTGRMPTLLVWRDPSQAPLNQSVWYTWSEYRANVLAAVLEQLRRKSLLTTAGR